MPRPPFKGMIKLDVRDSVPDWDALHAAARARGRAERAGRPLRRHRPGRLVAVRRADQHADAAAAGRQRADLHRSGTPPRSARRRARRFLTGRNHHQNGFASHHRGRDRLPGLQRAHPAGVRDDRRRSCATTAGARSGSARTTTCRSTTCDAGASEAELAAAAGLRPLLRLHRRRDQQVVSRPGRGQPLHRPAVHARGGLPPLQGPRRPGARRCIRDTKAADAVDKPWYLWFCPGANHAPHHAPAGVHRQVQGQVRRRLRGLPRVGAAADDRARHPARGHRADAASTRCPRARPAPVDDVRPWDTLNDDEKRLFCADGRGLRRLLRVHRRPGRPDHRLPRGDRPARQHDRSSTAPTTAPPARAARTARSTRTSSSTATPTTSRRT